MGEFLEVEVVLDALRAAGEGERTAAELLARFGIGDCDLVASAYADLLEEGHDSTGLRPRHP